MREYRMSPASIFGLLLCGAVVLGLFYSKWVLAQGRPVDRIAYQVPQAKPQGAPAVGVTRLVDSTFRVVCYVTDRGAIACVRP